MPSMYGDIALYTGTASPELAREVAQALGVELSGSDVFKFPNDNIFIRLHGSVRSRDVFIIQPTCPPVNTNIMQLLIYIDTMKRDSAGRVTAVVPYSAMAAPTRRISRACPSPLAWWPTLSRWRALTAA